MTGVWIINGKDVFYNQFSTVTFLCPMRFERYPLDEHICKFKVRSTMHSEGIWGLMIAWVTVGHLGVTVGHFRATAGHLRVIKGPLRVRN